MRRPEVKKKVSLTLKRRYSNGELISSFKKYTEEHKDELVNRMKLQNPMFLPQYSGDKNPSKRPEVREKISNSLIGHTFTQETKEKIRKSVENLWLNPEYRDKTIQASMKSRLIKPNKIEKLLDEILQRLLPNEYRYVGNGEFILGGKCPDFLNINGKKRLIELFGDYWHENDNPEERINFFKIFGFETLVVWEHEFNDIDMLCEKIIQFNG